MPYLQGTYALRPGQDKALRRIGIVFQERIPDESTKPLRLPGDPVADAPAPAPAAPLECATPASLRVVAGPARPPQRDSDDSQQRDASPSGRSALPEAEAQPRKGPAAPSAALRAAAAHAAAAMRAEGLLGDILAGVSQALVGPAPAALVAETETSALGTRDAEVERVLAVLDKVSRAGARRGAAAVCSATATTDRKLHADMLG
jgi:hypothetical protein